MLRLPGRSSPCRRCSPALTMRGGRRAGLGKLREIPCLQGMTEIVTLSFVTSPGLKESELLFRFHAFGDHPLVEAPGHADHRTDDRGIVGIEEHPVHER